MTIQELRNVLRADGVLFSLSGTLSQDVLTSVAETLEEQMGQKGISGKIIQNIFAIFVEQAQNVMSYSAECLVIGGDMHESPGLAIVGFDRDKEAYYVASGNAVVAERVAALQDYLETINGLDEAGVKELYRSRRRSGECCHRRGAGLGLLDMRRRSGQPLDYSLTDSRDGTFFLSLKAYLR